jgi:glycosyltransferase involved in cell wall biosynthesis
MIPVPNVADTDLFYPAALGEQVTDPMREIALIARLSEEKAVYIAIQAAARLQQQGIYFQLQIAGDGPQRASLETMVADLRLSDWVHFHGYLPKPELAKLLRRSSALLLTSLWESQPVVILEALSCGLPVVAPTIGGIPEIITPDCGLLFRPGDLDDLCVKLSSLLTNISVYNPHVVCKYAIAHFSPTVVGNRFSAIYHKIIEDRHAFDSAPGL